MSFPVRLFHTKEPVSPPSDERGAAAALPPAIPGGRIFYSGFTLLEMLLVIFIMGLLASAASMMTDSLDTQNQYEDTKRRLETIRRAIVGEPGRTVNDGPEIGGFVADMGRLPYCLRELLDGKCVDADPPPVAWQLDALTGSGLWAGWRGPYLLAMPGVGGARAFRDGWANVDADAIEDAKNFGWVVGGVLNVQSLGKDGATGGSGLDADYPDAAAPDLIAQNDYQVNLLSWDEVAVQFDNDGMTAIVVPAASLRLRMNYPSDGMILDWTDTELDTALERDAAPYLSAAFPEEPVFAVPADQLQAFLGVMTVPAGSMHSSTALQLPEGIIALPTGSTLSGTSLTLPANTPVPVGSTLSGTTTLTLPTATVSVPAGSTLSGTTLTLPSGTAGVPVGTTLSGTTLTLPAGGGTTWVPTGSSLTGTTLTLPRTVTMPVGSALSGSTLKVHTAITVPSGSSLDETTWQVTLSGDATVPNGTSLANNTLTLPGMTISVPSASTVSGTTLTLYAGINTDAPVAGNLAKYVATVPSGSSLSGTTLTLPLLATVIVPAGSTLTSTRLTLGGDTLTVPAGTTLSGTILTMTTGDSMSVPEGSVLSGTTLTVAASLPVPWGVRSLTVVCENDGIGELYDGDCTPDIDGRPTPYFIKLIPSLVPPLKPSPLNWTIH